MKEAAYHHLIQLLNSHQTPLRNGNAAYENLFSEIGDARFVLIGEASHGTKEFYQVRAEITEELIKRKGFMAVAIEGDWPDVYPVNQYIQGQLNDPNEALAQFKRFPLWMWRNEVLPPTLHMLRKHNERLPLHQKVGFYGLDLYSLFSSMKAVIEYLSKVDPIAAERARRRYACFDHIQTDPQKYGYLTTMGAKKPCMQEAIDQLIEMQHHAFEYVKKNGFGDDEFFYAAQNARLVKNAEKYYRSMFGGHIESWNIRDTHMAETLNVLADHLTRKHGEPAKIVVWAHNSHIGDAEATEMGFRGELNLGQLTREHHPEDTYLIGFSTYAGTVTAADEWDTPGKTKKVMNALPGSYEAIFHDMQEKQFIINFRNQPELEHYLKIPHLQRAIGVIYRPDTERESHYYFVRLPYQFDSIIHIDKTSAVAPLDAVELVEA